MIVDNDRMTQMKDTLVSHQVLLTEEKMLQNLLRADFFSVTLSIHFPGHFGKYCRVFFVLDVFIEGKRSCCYVFII